MAILKAKEEFFDIMNRIITAADPLKAMFGVQFDHSAALTAFAEVDPASGSAITLSRTLISASFPAEGGDFIVEMRGSNLGPISSLSNFLAAMNAGTATGTLSSMTVSQAGTTVMTLTPTASGLRMVSGDQVLTVQGDLSNSVNEVSTFLRVLNDPESLQALPAAERQAILDRFDDNTITGITLADGPNTLMQVDITDTSVVVVGGGLRFVMQGDVPDTLGALLEAYYNAAVGGSTGLFGLIEATGITSIDIYRADGTQILDSVGDVSTLDLNWVIEGRAVTDSMDMLWALFDRGTQQSADPGVATVLIGTVGNDRLTGAGLGDHLLGLSGADRLVGNGGNDFLRGWAGQDTILGGKGSDFVRGGAGNDLLTGGAGADRFVFGRGEGSDRITDFVNGSDRLQINNGASNFSQISVQDAGADTVIRFADVTIRLVGFSDHTLIDASDFLFG